MAMVKVKTLKKRVLIFISELFCVIIDGALNKDYGDLIYNLKSFITPEERIIKSCFEKGGALYSNGDYKQSNKYFSKIMLLSTEDSSDYKFAKSRLVNV